VTTPLVPSQTLTPSKHLVPRGAGVLDVVPNTTGLPVLADLQWSLDDSVVLGPGTDYNVSSFSFGGAERRLQDTAIGYSDGDRFGVDRLGGRLITLDANTDGWDTASGLRMARKLEAAWDGEPYRSVPGRHQVLRWRRGSQVLRAYGRSRECIPDHSMDWTGNIPYTLTFRTSEPRFYSDFEFSEAIGFVPEEVGGLIGDLIGDIVASGYGASQRGFEVGGDLPTWVIMHVRGPITNPIVEFTDQWRVQLITTIREGDSVLIDPTPWGGPDVRTSGGANAAGMLTPSSRLLSQMKLPPGRHQAVLLGSDPTGTSSVEIIFRDCYASH
jgi:hypothetical protein